MFLQEPTLQKDLQNLSLRIGMGAWEGPQKSKTRVRYIYLLQYRLRFICYSNISIVPLV